MIKFRCWIEQYGQTEDDELIIEVPDDCSSTDAACRFVEQFESLYDKYPVGTSRWAVVVSTKQECRHEISKIKVHGRTKPIYFASTVDWAN